MIEPYSFTEKLAVVSKQFARIHDICVLKDCCDSIGFKYKKQIMDKLGDKFIYPIPMSVVVDVLNVDENVIEKGAMREKKGLIKVKDTPTIESKVS